MMYIKPKPATETCAQHRMYYCTCQLRLELHLFGPLRALTLVKQHCVPSTSTRAGADASRMPSYKHLHHNDVLNLDFCSVGLVLSGVSHSNLLISLCGRNI